MIRLRAESPFTSHPPPPIVLPHIRASMAMLRAVAPSTYILAPRSETPPSGTPPLLPIPLHASSLPLLLPSTIHRANVREVALPPRKRLCITLGLRFEVGESSSAPTARPAGVRADYGFVGTLDDEIRRDPEREVGYRIIDTWDEMVEDIQGALKMAPKRTTRATPATTITTTTTPVTNAQLKALIDQGVADALAARDADRSRNGKGNHDSGTGTVGTDVAYAMTWTNLKKKMADKYYLRDEIKKLEVKL
nr:hypothetical protein [Tanacetum cinerariifolium]